MAPSGADVSTHEMSSSLSFSSPTAFLLARDVSLTTDQGVLMTHLVVWLLTFLSALFFGLRLGAKCYRRAGLAVDDALLAAAWAAVLFYSVISSLELALGLGTDNSSSSPSSPSTSSPPSSSPSSSSSNTNAEALILLDHVARTFCLTAAAWSKSAVAVMLLKVPSRGGTPGSSKPWNSAVHGVLFTFIAVVNTGFAAAIIAHWFRCAPITKEWDSSVDGSCWSMAVQEAISIAAQSFSGAMDVALVAIGLLLVWGLDLSVGARAGALGLSFLGIVASATSITTAIEIATLTDSKFTSANLRILLAASIESPLVIIIASLPALRLFNKNYLPSSSSSPHAFGAAYLKHKNGDSGTSTTIRLLPAGRGTISPHDGPPPSTSHSSVFPGTPATPLRGKASFSSSIPASGGTAPARPPRPASVEAGVGPGMFWADPTAPAALNGGTGAGSVRSATGTTMTTITARGQQANTNNNGRPGDESARGLLLLSPGEGASPSPYTPGWRMDSATSPAPTSAAPMISPYNNPPSYPHAYHNDFPTNDNNNNNRNNFHNQPTTDAFDTYYDANNFPAGLVAPRVLTPLEEEEQDFHSRASSYHSSAISESTMTNSHWLDIPVPHPDNEGGGSRRESSKFSMSGFLDSYGPRAASVLRKMDLIIPLGAGGGAAQQQAQQQQEHQGYADGSVAADLNFGKAGNRDSPTLGDYWRSVPSSPAAATPTTMTTPAMMTPSPGRRADAGAGFRTITAGGGGMAKHPWQQHLKDSSMSSYTSYSNATTTNSNNDNNRF